MAASMQVNTFPDVANMFTTGLLDDQFHQLQLLQDDSAPNFVAEVVTFFCEDGGQIIGELAKLLDKPCVDFVKVDAFVHQLKGSSASVGAQKVKNTCVQFHEFSQEKSRDGCLKALNALRNDFCDLRNKFQTLLQGLLDDQFHHLQLLQDGSAPNFVAEVIKLFCEDSEKIIGELAKLLDKPCVDFDKVDAFVHQLGVRSTSVGAQRVKNACVQFHEFIQEKSRDGCLKALYALRNDFYDLRNKFQNLLQLEKQVEASYPKQ